MCMNWIGDSSEYLAIGGQDRKINLYSYEGCQLGALNEENSWILSSSKHPRENCLVSKIECLWSYLSCAIGGFAYNTEVQSPNML